ncbi:MAG: hypothetical protein ABI599_00200 [Flavobacteriales bacterium]
MPVQYQPDALGNTQRPGLVTFLGILSFINTGGFLLLYGFAWWGMSALSSVPYEEFAAKVEEAMEPMRQSVPEEKYAQIDTIMPIMYNTGALLCALLFLRTLVRLVGTIGIWRAKRGGFFIYAVAQIGGIFLPMVLQAWSMVGVFGLFMSVAMTAAFGSQLKRLN